MRRLNWPAWLGFLISFVAFFSYPLLFVNWAITRDFPWVSIVLFAVAAFLLFLGIRRAFQPGRRLLSKIVVSILTLFSALTLAMFIFVAFIAARWLPASSGAPQVNQKAPPFVLTDTTNKSVSLDELMSQPIEGKPPKGVLLIFYRGYW
ncbi:MAG TPA: hypothetical protein VFU37_01690 [Pyrinomonadaceae bacterium]|nr:hypothetical protein [Pyrinomonadaceae bacterium]